MKTRIVGFTLLEVLIATGLLSLLMLMLFSSLRTGSRAWEAVDRQSQIQTEQRHVSRFLNDRIQKLKTIHITHDAQKQAAFIGHSQEISFVTPLFEYTSMAGLYYLQYALDTSNQQLVVRFLPFKNEDSPAEGIEQLDPELLLENVDAFEINYYTSDKQWVDEWRESVYPKLIRLQLTVAGEVWPEIVIRTNA